MKGTFFSSDFVRDSNGDLRLLEINTDTSAGYGAMINFFDYTDFIQILSNNNITDLVLVYKIGLHVDIVSNMKSVIETSATFITSVEDIIIPGDSIFPESPADSPGKFILRFAYDESAILDSEYAKGTLNLLKLFADNGDSGSIVNFYHFSASYGEYNTLQTSSINPSNIPDFVIKPVLVDHKAFPFYKIGKSELTMTERYSEFLKAAANSDNVIEQYHLSNDQIENNFISSIRSFQIVYGPNLDLCDVGEYEVNAVFELPESINYNDEQILNAIDSKHYYEFATNIIKNEKHGLLGDEPIIDINNNEIPISTMKEGDSYPSYLVNGSPNTDEDSLLDQWIFPGNTLPEGSAPATSTLIYLAEIDQFANEITKISFSDGASIQIGGGTRLLVYDSIKNEIAYVPCNRLTTDYSVFDYSGNTDAISSIDIQILEESEKLYSPNMEDVDTFLVGGSRIIRLISHNVIAGGACFIAGTKVSMGDGSLRNIEEIEIGDIVLSFNEKTKSTEGKKVMGLKNPIHDDMIKYTFTDESFVICTQDHPFYTNDYVLSSYSPELTIERYQLNREIHRIQIDDNVYTEGGNMKIKNIEVLPADNTQTYIISVEDNSNFYANGILVHNKT